MTQADDAAKSQPFLSSLKRAKVSATVEYVFSGTRFKLNVPSEGLIFTLVLQGLSADRVRPPHSALLIQL